MKNINLPDTLLRRSFWILLPFLVLLALKLLPDYGVVFDSPKNFNEGSINLHLALKNQLLTPSDEMNLAFQIHGAFFFMLGELSKQFFTDTWHKLDEVSARHVYLPFLVLIFSGIYFESLRKKAGAAIAGTACAVLLTYPHFVGHVFNNIKDIPLFTAFGATIFFFFTWVDSRFQKTRWLYLFFIALAFSLLSKLYALLAPFILLIWLITLIAFKVAPSENEAPLKLSDIPVKTFLHCVIGAALVAVFLALFFMPGIHRLTNFKAFWDLKMHVLKDLLAPGKKTWSLYPWIQIIFVTPLLTLLAAAAGTRAFKLRPLDLLMLIWFGIIVAIPCTPVLPAYGGIRLFMTYLVPFSYFAAKGIFYAAECFSSRLRLPQNPLKIIFFAGVIAAQICVLKTMHPYEAAYFNTLAGGLEGAQLKKIPDAGDFWLTAFREGTDWVNHNAEQKAYLIVPNQYSALMIRYYPVRKDIGFDFARHVPLPHNTYFMLPENDAAWIGESPEKRKAIEEEVSRMQKVHEIKRQGGRILDIFYKP